MYDVNPLGPLMHLKDLDRQAIPKLQAVQFRRKGSFSVAADLLAFLQRLHGRHSKASHGTGPCHVTSRLESPWLGSIADTIKDRLALLQSSTDEILAGMAVLLRCPASVNLRADLMGPVRKTTSARGVPPIPEDHHLDRSSPCSLGPCSDLESQGRADLEALACGEGGQVVRPITPRPIFARPSLRPLGALTRRSG